MKVMLAKSAGFCFGVRRAVQLADYYGVTLDYLTGRTDTP